MGWVNLNFGKFWAKDFANPAKLISRETMTTVSPIPPNSLQDQMFDHFDKMFVFPQ